MTTDMKTTVVIGNIPGVKSFEAAEEWVKNHCEKMKLGQPTETFFKTEFRGFVFAKCISIAQRDSLITSINECSKNMKQEGDNKLFANVEQPLDIRMAESCLFRFKRMLWSEWGYNKSCIKVVTESNPPVLKIADKEIVQAYVQDFNLILKWSDGEWEAWEDLQSSGELVKIKTEVQSKLTKAKDLGQAKGKGKRSPE